MTAQSPAVLRLEDLLPADQPIKAAHPRRLSVAVRWVVFGATYTAVVAAMMPLALRGGSLDINGFLIGQAVAAIVAYAVLVWGVEARRPPVELAGRRWTGLLAGMAAGILFIGVCVGVVAIAGGYRITGLNHSYRPATDLVIMGLAAPVSQELVFRGGFLRLVEDIAGTWAGLLVSAACFGAIHLIGSPSLVGAAAVALYGVLFGAIYVATRSLWWVIGLHIAWNVMEGPVFGYTVSGMGSGHGWFSTLIGGPAWLTGGAYGLETSLVPLVLAAVVATVVMRQVVRLGRVVSPSWVRRRAGSLGMSVTPPKVRTGQ